MDIVHCRAVELKQGILGHYDDKCLTGGVAVAYWLGHWDVCVNY